MIAIIDYGMGNLRSVEKAFVYLGHDVKVSRDPASIENVEGIVLPGVGAFGDAMRELSGGGFIEPLRDAVAGGKPLLGICLGFQLLFEESEESPGIMGLGILPGRVVRFPPSVKIPHMGWNDVCFARSHPVLEGVEEGSYFYFVHSYYVVPREADDRLTTTGYGMDFASGVARDRLIAFQFHPEKSSASGMRILSNFARMCG
ncbi:MAG: imidazole glycerol phosphate synthase subunit HisH [Actinobacteria bacterium]|jgi:glutamine amidotransferase|nr:MAG: imidazole glycerol phosphate synthase subunit HisH [Actinomycetota bacterium]